MQFVTNMAIRAISAAITVIRAARAWRLVEVPAQRRRAPRKRGNQTKTEFANVPM